MAVLSFKSVGEKFDSFENRRTQSAGQNPIGLVTPLRISTTQKDIFEMHYNLGDQIADNLRNLILTNHGERLGLHDFGANLSPILFDLQSDDFEVEAMTRIKSATSKFLPFVDLKTFETRTANAQNLDEGISNIVMSITFDVPVANVIGKKLEVTLSSGG
tara:strand:- start:8985 stop:9464 length:480 start_codon:yes stop_codon:yes gene_type:complete